MCIFKYLYFTYSYSSLLTCSAAARMYGCSLCYRILLCKQLISSRISLRWTRFHSNMNSSPKISKSKRSLPSSPNSPIQTETKKNKSFVSPNKFAVLANNEDHDVQLDTSSDTTNIMNESNLHHQQDNLRAPPVYVQNITNYSAFKNALIQITGLKRFFL